MTHMNEKFSSKETAVLYRWRWETRKFDIERVEKGQIYTRNKAMKLTFRALAHRKWIRPGEGLTLETSSSSSNRQVTAKG